MSRATLAEARTAVRPRQPAGPRTVYVISDSTGNLARHMLTAFLTQFPPRALDVRYETFVRTPPLLKGLLERAREERAAVCHAVVAAEFKETISRFCKKAKLPCHDLTGGIVDFLADVATVQPHSAVEALHRIDATYRLRIRAMEYTMSHDDGLGLDSLHEADLVLTGVSRTSKTPTSIYLAQQGFRVANVSLALGVEPPAELLRLPPPRVVGLLIEPQQLVMIRSRRASAWNMGESNYGDPDYVIREIAWTRRLFAERGWPSINVTDSAIEETAARIIDLVDLPHPQPGHAASGDFA